MRALWLEEIKTVKYITKLIRNLSSGYFLLMFVASLFEVALPFFNLLLFRDFVNALINKQDSQEIIQYVSILVVGNGLLYFINKVLTRYIEYKNESVTDSLRLHIGKKVMDLKFELLEDPYVIRIKDQALDALKQQDIMKKLLENLKKSIVSLLMILGLSTLILALSPLILLGIIGVTCLNLWLFQKSQHMQFKLHQTLQPLNRKFGYYMKISNDVSMAKDIRISNMSDYIIEKVKDYHQEVLRSFGVMHEKTGLNKGLMALILQVQTFLLYGYMTLLVLRNFITIGSFLMYLSASSQFSTHFNNLFQSLIELRQVFKYFEAFRLFDAFEQEELSKESFLDLPKSISIEFKHVYFRYRESETYVLNDVSFKINDGEKIALVGQNGAGKSTIIKLLCGLYQPTSGEIIVNGTTISELNLKDYLYLLSSVFQDSKLFSFTILENLVANSNDPTAKDQIYSLLKGFNMEHKVKGLKSDLDSFYSKDWNDQGVVFSGGEAQKLTIIRALMKKAPILIMDEPTSALDAYTESDIYSSLNDMQQTASARIMIYVSHRLSSCKFCDRVLVFQAGHLVEQGDHVTLLRKKGEYARLWEVQAVHYIV